MQISSLFPFIPPHIFVLAYALVLIWIVFRWDRPFSSATRSGISGSSISISRSTISSARCS